MQWQPREDQTRLDQSYGEVGAMLRRGRVEKDECNKFRGSQGKVFGGEKPSWEMGLTLGKLETREEERQHWDIVILLFSLFFNF